MKPTNEEFENGEVCVICNARLCEPYGRPIACSDCGGDAVKELDFLANELKDDKQ